MAEKIYYAYTSHKGLGDIGLSPQVFGKIAETVTNEERNVSLEQRTIAANYQKGAIVVTVNADNEINITVEINIRYGKNVNRTTKTLQDKIGRAISDVTSVQPKRVDIKVVGVDF